MAFTFPGLSGLGAAVGLLAAGLCVAQALPTDASWPIHIPAQPLGKALHALGLERGLQLVYRSEFALGVRSPEVSGDYTAGEVMTQLLSGTGLAYYYLDDKTLTIVPVSEIAPGDAGDAGAAATGNSLDQALLLEEVLVTAQKVTEMASKTPLALGAHAGESLKERGINSVSDLQDIETSVNVGRSPAGVTLSIRGVTTTDNTSKGDQGIAFNIDGIPVGRPREMGLAFFDLERVEVLRGPQGTLYGKSSTGGAINLITNKPKDSFAAAASLEFGNYSARRGDGMINLPLGSQLAVRAAARFNVRDGYLHPDIATIQTLGSAPPRNDQEDLNGRLSARWKISNRANLLLTGTFGRVAGVGPASALVTVGPKVANYRPAQTRNGQAALKVYNNPFEAAIDQRVHNLNTELNVDFGAVQLAYVGARLRFDAHDLTSSTNDPRGRAGGSYGWTDYRGSYDTNSHELRFTNAFPQRAEWVAGANYYDEIIREDDHSWNAPISNPTLSASINATGILARTDHRSSGLFAQAHVHASKRLRLTVGVRHSSDSVRRRGTFATGAGPASGTLWLDPQGKPCVAPNDCIGTRNDGDQSARKLTWRLGADVHLNDNQMAYVSVATGYKAGGFNDFDAVSNAPVPYVPEQLTAYEVGFKGPIRPNLQFNAAGFFYDYSRNQISSVVMINGIGVLYTRAVPTVILGWESELRYRISDRQQLDAALSLEKSRYTRFLAGVQQNVDWTGHSLDKTPSVAAMLGYTHRWRRADGSYLEARASSRFSSGYLVSDFVGPEHYRQSAFIRSDLLLAYHSAAGRFYIQAYIRNAEDELQILNAPQSVSATFPGSANAAVSEPHTMGIRVGLRY
jgi:iron complex outermembrane receptor protein